MTVSHRFPYFNRFREFEPDPRRPLDEEFQRLARFQGWARKSKQYVKERRHFLLAEFDQHLGTVERSRKLDDWQALCTELGILPVHQSIRQCKKVELYLPLYPSGKHQDSQRRQALSTEVHVNLIDLLDSRRRGTKVKIFKTRAELISYTIVTRKFFPKDRAKKDGLLKILLREIL